MAKITIVGAGPGSPDYVTPIARKIVQKAQLVVGAERVLSLFKNDIKGETLKLTAKNLNEALQQCVDYAEEGKTVALLSTGDPGFSGLLRTFRNATKGKNVDVDVVPGVSSLQACAAKLAMTWDEIDLFSFHEGASLEKKKQLLAAVKEGSDVVLLPNPKVFVPSNIAKFLIDKGIASDTPAFVCENLTLNNERVEKSTLKGVSGMTFRPLCVMVIRPNRKQISQKQC
ncbi:MAG TPA: precorrin-6y C5,15-methyltransferase (decarboxylating) subunit CbiE [Candidatus Bathyarchaeia archaeon]|nr:precorrin-6y C5,15-methyltransferase (decarboxylating) subunit CbiE [Candidatus Bathyarchaeia archaeon]